ncbi:hypothetical protein KKH39_02085 [Patescibacteria group bacterium]|nr:hypothetical protein [Patescibacteria group bacterium]
MNENFLLLYLNIIEKPSRWNLGAGIHFDGYSFDGGQSWYILVGDELFEEHDLELAMFVNSMCGCAG